MEFIIWFIIVTSFGCGLVFLFFGLMMLEAYRKESNQYDEIQKEHYRKFYLEKFRYGGLSILVSAIAGLLLIL